MKMHLIKVFVERSTSSLIKSHVFLVPATSERAAKKTAGRAALAKFKGHRLCTNGSPYQVIEYTVL